MPHVLALDAGTTSCRAIVFDDQGAIRAVAQKPFEQIFPKPGWVEHDALEIWSTQLGAAAEAITRAHLRPRDIAAIGITNQRETTVVWERDTGRPIHNAIVWQDRRTAPQCERLRADGLEPLIQRKAGLVVDSYFSATKIAWILDNVRGARERAERGELVFGTIDSWLAWRLSAGAAHITDVTNASRTMLFDIHRAAWDDELLNIFRIPRAMLPEVRSSSEVYAETEPGLIGDRALPIAGIAGDQQSALFGQRCLSPGETKTTYGTGCFTLQHTGAKPVASSNRLLTTIALQRNGETTYALEGSVFMGGATVQWLRDGLGVIRTSDEIGPLAASVPDNGGACLVPAFTGLGAPHWDAGARGLIIGLTRGTTRAHIARAALEAIAHQNLDVIEAMRADSGLKLTSMRVDGGAVKNDLLMQVQADLLGVELVRPANIETTALGAAALAGLAVGLWTDPRKIGPEDRADRHFEPKMSRDGVQAMREQWRRAVERARGWAEENT